MQRRRITAKQAHALFATRHQQGLQLQVPQQRRPALFQHRIVGARPHYGLEFLTVGGDEAGAAIPRKILAFGIRQHRLSRAPGLPDQGLNGVRIGADGALAVVRQHHNIGLGQQVLHAGGHLPGGVRREGLFEIHADQLLTVAQHAQLGDGRTIGNPLEDATHPVRRQQRFQLLRLVVLAGQAQHRGAPAQGRHVQRHIARAARAMFFVLNMHHLHRRFRGNTRAVARPVPIQHYVAHNQHGRIFKWGRNQPHGAFKSRKEIVEEGKKWAVILT